MIVYDGIIENLQNYGGITVLFKEVISRMDNYRYISYKSDSVISSNSRSEIKYPLRFGERYRDVFCPTDASIFHSTYYRLPIQRNVKVVTTVHDFTYEKYVKGFAQKVHSWQKNRAILNSDRVICVSQNTAIDLMKYCPVNENRIVVVNNGVSQDYRPLADSNNYTNEVVFIGARGGYKNFFSAVDSIALSSELTLSIVGGGLLTSTELTYLKNRIPGRYTHLGTLSNEDLNKLYNRAYCLLYPSSYEGFGIPVIEAMRAGCPVIAINSSSIPEVVGDNNILVEKPEPQLIFEALIALDNSIERDKWIAIGLANSKKFSWERCYNETRQVYGDLV